MLFDLTRKALMPVRSLPREPETTATLLQNSLQASNDIALNLKAEFATNCDIDDKPLDSSDLVADVADVAECRGLEKLPEAAEVKGYLAKCLNVSNVATVGPLVDLINGYPIPAYHFKDQDPRYSDTEWIMKKLLCISERKAVAEEYSQIFIESFNNEPIKHHKPGRARFIANSWLRLKVKEYREKNG